MNDTHHRRDEGATAVEYAIMVVLVAAIIVAVVVILGKQTCEGFEATSSNFAANATVTPAGACA